MYSREEEFWTQRLAALQSKQHSTIGFAHAALPPASTYIPAYIPPSLASQPQRRQLPPAAAVAADDDGTAAGTTALVQGAAVRLQLGLGPAAPAAPTAADTLVQAAQVEALKLQVAQLRRANAVLQQQLASAAAEQAAAAKRDKLQQLATLQRDPDLSSRPGLFKAGWLASGGAASSAADASQPSCAAVQALQEELGVALPTGAESVPLLYLQQMHATYQRRLAELQQKHADALHQRATEAEAQLQRQAEQHAREVRQLTEGLDDPAREAEVQLLRDDCRYLKDKLQQLAEEYQRRVEVAAAEARLSTQRQAAEQQRERDGAAAAERQRLEVQLAEAQAAALTGRAAAEDEAALERARHAAELARLREQQAADTAELRADLQQRESAYNALLAELHAFRASLSAPPSRAPTRQEDATAGAGAAGGSSCWAPSRQHAAAGWPHAAAAPAAGRSQLSAQALAPGQLMEPLSDEEEQPRHAQAWEQPRQTPQQLLQHLKASQCRAQRQQQSKWE